MTTGIGTFSWDAGKTILALTAGTFSRRGRAGDLGPIHLVMVPLIAWWAWRHRRQFEIWLVIAYVAVAVAAWAAGPPLGRYLFPVVAVSAGLVGASWSEVGASWSRSTRIAVTAVLAVVLVANCNPVRGEYLFDQIRCFLGAGDSDEYLEARCTQIEPFRAANELLPLDAKVLLVGEPRPYEIDRDVVVEDQFGTPLLVELANSSTSAEAMAVRLREMGVTHILWNAAEAARIAEAEGRSGFLVCTDETAQARLDRFLSELTQPVASGGWWEIVRIPG